LAGKWLELIKETVPKVSRIAVLAVSQTLAHHTFWTEIQAAAKPLGVSLQREEVTGPNLIEHTFDNLTKIGAQGLIVLPHAVTFAHRVQIVSLAAKNQLPGMYSDRLYAEDGGLMSYGIDLVQLHQRAAMYLDKILKGAKPADLPVEQPKKFILAINLKTAKQIGLTIPPNVLAGADRVIR
jgi:putative ABC transport system substrate-binding protein